MTLFSSEHSSKGQTSSFGHAVLERMTGLQTRVIEAWARHKAERALEGLSYEALKDIGFPSFQTKSTDRADR